MRDSSVQKQHAVKRLLS